MKPLIGDKAIPKSVFVALAAIVVGGMGLFATTMFVPKPPPTPPAPAAPARYVAPRPNAPEFAACDWVEVLGTKLSMWSFACGAGHGDAHLEPDSGLPGFWLVGEGGKARAPVVRTFPNTPGTDDAIKAIRVASPGPGTASCILTPAPGVDGVGKFMLTPTGALAAKWEKEESTGDYTEAPCGGLGVDIVGNRYFWPMPGHPEVMVFADMGSEIQIFDPATLRLVPQAPQ